MVKSKCKQCGEEITRAGSKPGVFCSRRCKGEWQRSQKPVTREWLYQKYVVEKLGTYRIGKLVNRDPKRVYDWLVDLNIPIRKRAWENEPSGKLHQQENWLREEYIRKGRSTGDIARGLGVTEALIIFYLKRFQIPRRSTSEARALKYWGLEGEENPMYGRRGPEHPNWKGGLAPERQALYNSEDWAKAVNAVWARDERTCQRCGKIKTKGIIFHIHHIIPFAVKEFRIEIDNLVLLCRNCHYWVHGRQNTESLWVEGGDD